LAAMRASVGVRADDEQALSANGERLGAGLRGVAGPDIRVEDDEVGFGGRGAARGDRSGGKQRERESHGAENLPQTRFTAEPPSLRRGPPNRSPSSASALLRCATYESRRAAQLAPRTDS